MELKMIGAEKPLEVSESAFGREFNEALVHQVVVAYLSTARAGTKARLSVKRVPVALALARPALHYGVLVVPSSQPSHKIGRRR